jgi:hypothetical protein
MAAATRNFTDELIAVKENIRLSPMHEDTAAKEDIDELSGAKPWMPHIADKMKSLHNIVFEDGYSDPEEE